MALALPLVIVALTAGGHYLGQRLEARGERLQRLAAARGRAAALLDLARELAPASRGRVVAVLSKEAGADPGLLGPPLRGALERCGGGAAAVDASCAAALKRLASWAGEADGSVRRNRHLRLGLLVLLALAAGVLGWIAVRHIRGRLAGLCLLGVALLVVGAGWRVNEVFRQAAARDRAVTVDGLVVRGRLMIGLPDTLRARRLQRLTAQLTRQPDVRAEGLREAVSSCGRRRIACGKVLVALGRIHADNRATAPATRIRRWIDRWLLWSGLVFLLLVALVTAARRGGIDPPKA